MKKNYLLLLALSVMFTGFTQSPIVTVDRDNTAEPTATGTTLNISAIGLSRGVGINQRNGTDFTSRDWDAASQAEAVTNNEYMEWSVSSNINYSTELTEIDIRLRRNANGPANWQLYYSLDGFATAGTAINSVVSLVENTNVDYNINGLSIDSGDTGTITFRLYAWNANANNGWLRVRRRGAWSGFGIDLPGIRLTGNITNENPTVSSDSDIISSLSFTPDENIDYKAYNVTSGLTNGNAVKIGEFTIQDGGGTPDTDLLPTTLTDLGLTISGSSNLAAIALFDGVTNLGEITTVGDNASFSGLILTALDNGSKSFDVYATFKNSVTDNEQIRFTINSATPSAAGSTFAASDAGGAQTSIAGDDNRIEVTRSILVFSQQPTDVNLYEAISPSVKVQGVDSNNNLDLDYIGEITINGSPINVNVLGSTANAIAGEAVFNNLVFDAEGSTTLVATSPGVGLGISDSFTIYGPQITIARQDFDNATPGWNYTQDTPSFDNGWGVGGYYGIIDFEGGNAAPLNHSSFSNNIFGENDLDQGTPPPGNENWATIALDPVDISGYTDVKVQFDWQVVGYNNNADDAQYRLILDGVNQSRVFLLNGNDGIPDGSGSISLDIDDSVNTVALEVRVRNNGINGYSGFDNFRVVSTFDGLVYDNNVWTPSAPTGSTNSSNALIIEGTYTIGTDIALNNLFVNTGAEVSIIAGQSLTLDQDLINLGTVTLNSVSNGYSSLIVNGEAQGNVVYNRFVNASSGGNDLISAPVSGETFGAFASSNANIVSNPSNTTEKLFGPFDKTTGTYLTWDTNVPAEAGEILTVGVGYRAASTDASTFSFEGLVNIGSINVDIFNSGPVNAQWNLIGNPYPSYIKLSDFLTANNAQFDPINSGVYGYNGAASDKWEIWNQAFSDANPNALIAPGQGFQVSSASATGTISFNSGMRSVGVDDDFIPGEANNGDPSIVHFDLNIKNEANDTYLTNFYITDKASKGLDPNFDAGTFGGNAPQFAIYSHLVEENSGIDMAIQSIGFTDLESELIIPLGINASQGERITVSMKKTTLPRDVEVYLEDSETNSFTLLTASDYIFTANTASSTTGRFFLRLTRNVLSAGNNELNNIQIFTKSDPKTLFINGQLDNKAKITIFDIQGRLVKELQLNVSLLSNKIDLNSIDTGVYIVKLNNNSLTKTQKVIIR